jgi:hypothetical protein
MPRMRENAFCCGAGRGTKKLFRTLRIFGGTPYRRGQICECGGACVACPWCKSNFSQTVRKTATM